MRFAANCLIPNRSRLALREPGRETLAGQGFDFNTLQFVAPNQGHPACANVPVISGRSTFAHRSNHQWRVEVGGAKFSVLAHFAAARVR